MDHHGHGYSEAHPSYMEEKLALLDRGYDAFAALDSENQDAVIAHLTAWGYELPDEIAH